MTWLRDIFAKGRQGEAVRVRQVKASRARYLDTDNQRIELSIEVEPDGDRIILDLSTAQAAKAIHQLTNAHDAIHPPLRARTEGSWS